MLNFKNGSEEFLANLSKTLDVCNKKVDLYYVTLSALKNIGITKGFIAIVDEALSGKLVVRASFNIDGASNKILGASTTGEIAEFISFQTQQTIYIENIDNSNYGLSDLVLRLNIKSAIYTPISKFGILSAVFDELFILNSDEIVVFEQVAKLLCDSLERLNRSEHTHNETPIIKNESGYSQDFIDALKICMNTSDIKELSEKTLNYSREFSGSEFGFVGYLDPKTGYLIVPTMTDTIFPQCKVDGKTVIFEKAGGIGGYVLDKKEAVIANEPYKHMASVGTPTGHVPVRKFLGVPCIYREKVVGMIALANKIDDYNSYDLEVAKAFASLYAVAVGRFFAQEELIETKDNYIKLYNDAPILYYTISPNGEILQINNTATQKLKIDGIKNIDYILSNESKKVFQKEIKDLNILKQSSSFEIEYMVEGKTISVINSIIGDFDERGYLIEIRCTSTDITERKEAEKELNQLNEELEDRVKARTKELEESLNSLKRAQKQLIEAEKMASLGTLVAGVAHEINTPVGIGVTAITYLETITKHLEDLYNNSELSEEDLSEYLKTSKETIESIFINLKRASELIKSFKQVAVDQTNEEIREFNIKEYLNEIMLSLRNRIKKTKHVINIECDDIIINNYSGAFAQIITNLIINSLNHAFKGEMVGTIDIFVSKSDENIVLKYKDNGVGIKQEFINRVFDPFFTTDREKGTGLGLHIVYNLVTLKLKGEIKFDSKEGEGVNFDIIFPANIK